MFTSLRKVSEAIGRPVRRDEWERLTGERSGRRSTEKALGAREAPWEDDMTLDLRHGMLAGAAHAGELSAEEMGLILRHLPVQTSFADEKGTLLWWHGNIFSDCGARWIGRHVNDCHAPSSRPMIDRMVEEFRAGTKDAATFWKNEGGRLILYRYIAVRDGEGAYRGILETLEDITDIKGLEGEKKTLDW